MLGKTILKQHKQMRKITKTIKCKNCKKKFEVPNYFKKVSYCGNCFEELFIKGRNKIK